MTENKADLARAHMHKAVAELIDIDPPNEAEDGPCIVRSWVTLATVRYADGGNQMYLLTGDASGEPLPQWDRDGLLHYAIYDFRLADD